MVITCAPDSNAIALVLSVLSSSRMGSQYFGSPLKKLPIFSCSLYVRIIVAMFMELATD